MNRENCLQRVSWQHPNRQRWLRGSYVERRIACLCDFKRVQPPVVQTNPRLFCNYHKQSSAACWTPCFFAENCLHHTWRLRPALQRERRWPITMEWSLSWASVKPMERTAWRVSVDKHDSSVWALYTPRASSSRAVSIVDKLRKICHFLCHSSKESLYSSRSNAGG